jgi:hypothetical protein
MERTKSEYDILPRVGQPMDRNEIMSADELEKYKRGLQLISESHVEDRFRQMLADLLRAPTLPPPYKMQQMLTTWKVLWTWQLPTARRARRS